MRLLAALLLLLLAAAPAAAQRPERPPADTLQERRAAADTLRRQGQRPDTLPADSLRADSVAIVDSLTGDTIRVVAAKDTAALVEWAPEDSVMRALLAREGYVPVRYQGDSLRFEARERLLVLKGDPAAIQREQSTLVADTVIYADSARMLIARGDTNILRDPTQGSDLVSRGELRYDLANRTGTVTNLRTSTQETGQEWFVAGRQNTIVLADSARGRETSFYVHSGIITSCDLTEPHYHFKASEIKVVSKNILVARPAVLYVGDVPVMWLPFVFHDLRPGRRSGLIPPRFGVSDIVRNSPSYRRHIENLGWFFALNDYSDLTLWLNWRSGVRGDEGDPGFTEWHGQFRYAWIDRFMTGSLLGSYMSLNDGSSIQNVSWNHSQRFNQQRSLNASLNWTSNAVQFRDTRINPYQVTANISSRLNYSDRLGPFSLQLGGDRTQYVGRTYVRQTLPTLSLTAQPISVGDWLTWTPQFSFSRTDDLDQDQISSAIALRYEPNDVGGLDTVRIRPDRRQMTTSFQTPVKIFNFLWSNSFRVRDDFNEAPQQIEIADAADPSRTSTFVFRDWYQTSVDWETSISLPASFFTSTWKLTPSVSFTNVAPGSFWVRSPLSGGEWLHQSKRPSFGLSASPTFYGLFPGIGNFTRFRHSISPQLSFSYAPRAEVSEEFLRATNRSQSTSNIGIPQRRLTLNLRQTIEGKLRSTDPSDPDAGEKINLLSLTFSPLSYDFELARETGRTGLDTDNFSYTLRSDLLPGFDLSVGYDLFQGEVTSDTAVFKPYRNRMSARLSLNRSSNPLAVIYQVLGRPVAPTRPVPDPAQSEEYNELEQEAAGSPIAGTQRSAFEYGIDQPQEWQASISYTYTRERPYPGALPAFDPEEFCAPFAANPFQFDRCVADAVAENAGDDPDDVLIPGQIRRIARPTQNVDLSMSFPITQKWAAQWSTNYDFVRKDFAQQIVTLQRDLHDWRAIFAFTRASNGAFAFNFYIALKAQPDLKFDYRRNTYPATERQ